MVALVTPCSPSTTRRLLERFAFQGSTPALIRRELSHLTSRELDVLLWVPKTYATRRYS